MDERETIRHLQIELCGSGVGPTTWWRHLPQGKQSRIRARHKLQVPEMQRHYSDWEITGAPEVRRAAETSTQPFNPFEPSTPAHDIIAPMLLHMR